MGTWCCRRVTESLPAQELDERLPDGVEGAAVDPGQRVAPPVPARVIEVDEVDGGHALAQERRVGVEDPQMRGVGEDTAPARSGRRGAQPPPPARGRGGGPA